MPSSLSASDLVLLRTWQAVLALAAISLAIALALVVKRAFDGRRDRRGALRRAELSAQVYALLASPRDPRADSLALRPGDEPHLKSIALDVLRVTRGRDADRMVEILQQAGMPAWLERSLRSSSRSRRIRVLTLLARFDDRRSLDLLRAHLSDPALYVQLAALRGIADKGDLESLPEIVRVLGSARETNVPVLADILRRFGAEAVPSLAELSQSSQASQGIRMAAVSALGRIGSLAAYPALSELAVDTDPALRAEALAALGKLGDPRAVPQILGGLSAPEARVRAHAAEAAGLIGARETLAALGERLEDEAWEVRHAAAEALYRLGSTGIALLRAAAAAANEGDPAAPAGEMAREVLAEKEGLPA